MTKRLGVWLLAVRPRTLPAAVSPVVVGSAAAAADQGFRFVPALAALCGALLIQIGVNLANDYFDHVKGVDTGERLGPVRVTQSGLIAPGRVRAGMIITFLLAAAYGLPVFLWLSRMISPWVLLPFLSAPMASLLARSLWVYTGSALNRSLAGAARLALLFSLLLSLGLVLGCSGAL